MQPHRFTFTAIAATLLFAAPALGKTLTVNAMDNIYGAGQTSAPGGGNVPTAKIKIKGPGCVVVSKVEGSLACSSANGCITLNDSTGNNLNDPDGVGAAVGSSSNSGAGSISGLTAPYAGYLVGLFTPAGGPAGSAPAGLDFTQIGTNFATLSPLIDQTFFVGDGRTGDDTGKKQQFQIPAGAKALYFGISDACGYNGAPGCYGDNNGTFQLKVKITQTCQ